MQLFTSKFIVRPAGVTEIDGGVTAPAGFKAAGIVAGLKRSGRADLGLLVAAGPCTSAALYTPNAAAAAPIQVCRQELHGGAIQGVMVNSGNANACTGDQGLSDARAMVRLAAQAAGIAPESMAVASTGIIGQPLPMGLIEPGIAQAAAALSAEGGPGFAESIRTTDKIDKEGAVSLELSAGTVKLGICAKGAGMIAPNMATMLAFVTTDAALPAGLLHDVLLTASARSFNIISVDGDMSTNDCLYLLASGKSGVAIAAGSADLELFAQALAALCQSMALKMVADGEGATKTIEFKVSGAASHDEAARVARVIAGSPLVKTAFYGRDANWGRIMAAAGGALAGESALEADIFYEEVCLARAGGACAEAAAHSERIAAIMEQPEISVTIDLHRGGSDAVLFFSDLTHDYVTLNAEYTT